MAIHTSFLYQTTVSSELPAKQRYEGWLEPLIYGFEVSPPNTEQQQNFNGRVKSLITDNGEIHDVNTDTFDGFLSEKRISAEQYDKLALLYVVNGNIKFRYKNDTSVIAKPGQFVMFDARRSNKMHFVNARFIQLNLPRRAAQNYLINNFTPSQLSRMVSDSGLASLLGSQLKLFNDLTKNLSDVEKLAFLQTAESMSLSLLSSLPANHTDLSTIDKKSLYLTAIRYIDANLSLDNLTPELIANALGCSRSTLYRAFAKQGLLPADYIREQRLQKLAQLLKFTKTDIPIAQLAGLCGLYDAPNLSRLFKRKYTLSPQEYRLASSRI